MLSGVARQPCAAPAVDAALSRSAAPPQTVRLSAEYFHVPQRHLT